MIKPTSLYLIYTLLCGAGTVLSGSPPRYDGLTDVSEFMFYDATEECKKNTSLPCVTNFKYCSNSKHSAAEARCPEGAKKDEEMNWTSQYLYEFMEVERTPVVYMGFDSGDWIDVRWVNTNPKYPTVVTWWPSDSLSRNTFYQYKVVPTGETHANISFGFLIDDIDMQPGQFIASNLTKDPKFYESTAEQSLRRQITTSLLDSMPIILGIGQPDDPNFTREVLTGFQYETNISDSTSPFFYSSIKANALLETQTDTREYIKWLRHRIAKRWSIGVGVGVGVGVPLVAILAFWLGKRSGHKYAPVQQKKAVQTQSASP